MNRAKFYAGVKTPALFGSKLTQSQVNGMDAILDEWDKSGLTDIRFLGYMFGTTFRETGTAMQPVIETQKVGEYPPPSVDTAIARLESSFKRGKLPWVKTPYWRKDAEGKSWLGRGLVQITHKINYDNLGKLIGVDLISNPDRALEDKIAIKIMFEGMTKGVSGKGDFTKYSLEDFFNKKATDWYNARRIINGVESAKLVADYASAFHKALISAQ